MSQAGGCSLHRRPDQEEGSASSKTRRRSQTRPPPRGSEGLPLGQGYPPSPLGPHLSREGSARAGGPSAALGEGAKPAEENGPAAVTQPGWPGLPQEGRACAGRRRPAPGGQASSAPWARPPRAVASRPLAHLRPSAGLPQSLAAVIAAAAAAMFRSAGRWGRGGTGKEAACPARRRPLPPEEAPGRPAGGMPGPGRGGAAELRKGPSGEAGWARLPVSLALEARGRERVEGATRGGCPAIVREGSGEGRALSVGSSFLL